MDRIKNFLRRHEVGLMLALLVLFSWLAGFSSGRIAERLEANKKYRIEINLTDEQIQTLISIAAREANNG